MLRRGSATRRTPVLTWAVLSAVVVVTSHLSNRALRDGSYRWGHWRGLPFLLDGLVQYDGHRYLEIAASGYSYREGIQSTIVWFPLYPLAIRATEGVAGDPLVAAVGITLVAGLATLLLYWRWLGIRGSEGRARTVAFLALAVFPYAWFLYGTVYADALFLALVIGALVLVERDHPVLAGLVGALATATRPTGIIVVPALLAVTALRHGVLLPRLTPRRPAGSVRSPRRWVTVTGDWLRVPVGVDRSALRATTLAPGLAVVGLLAYAAYLWRTFGDPLVFLTNEATFHTGRYPLLKGTYVNRLLHVADTPLFTGTLTLQALCTLGILLAVGPVARRFGFPYALLVLGTVVTIVVGTHDFMGAGRYTLMAFPALAVAGERLATHPRADRVVLALSALLMVAMAFGFSQSQYLS